VVAYDFGIKHNILRMLTREGCRVTVVPAETTAEDVLELKPDGVFLSNGPGDPEPVDYAVTAIRKISGARAGVRDLPRPPAHGLALGGKTYKLKFGHHGGNHPVRNNTTGKVEITAHNHNFAVDPDSINANEVELTHVDLNDQTLEGPAAQDAAAVQRAVPSGSGAGAARLALSVPRLPADDGGVEGMRFAVFERAVIQRQRGFWLRCFLGCGFERARLQPCRQCVQQGPRL
jgi:carbamoyl-phosphate synthase small subunit